MCHSQMENMKQTRKTRSVIWRRLLIAGLGALLGVNVYLANAKDLAGNQMPMPFGFGIAVVLSGSMEPTLAINDMIVVHETGRYEAGDIVVYQSERTLIVHRIIAKDGDIVVTQGDANQVADAPIQIDDIKGKVIAHIPVVGMAVNALKHPLGILIVLIAVFALIELTFSKERDKDEKELEAVKAEIRQLKEEQKKRNEK